MSHDEKIWSGRFSKRSDRLMEEFSSSLHFDQKLFEADLLVNREWALALVDAGVYNREEAELVRTTLDRLGDEFNKGALEFKDTDEDIHTATERWLTERLGDLGARIHTGRSRNDQVVTDLRIYLKGKMASIAAAIADLQQVVVGRAEEHLSTLFAGQTHLRQAQPVSFAHYLLALFFQLARDKERVIFSLKQMDKCPLGSGAIAGAAFAIDRHALAARLGFSGPTENSYDSTSDRDFVNDSHFSCTQIVLHLSRVAEDLIIWSSEPYNYLEIDELYATGSSMMPQKRNPDSLELIRGKSARIIGNTVAGLTLMKGIPTAYVRDLQEDKEPLFDSIEQTVQILQVFTGVLDTMNLHVDRMVSSIDPALFATDLADYLVKKGVPFRKAHSMAGLLVSQAENKQTRLNDLSLDEYKRVSELFDDDLFDLFNALSSIEKRNLFGGSGPQAVEDQLYLAKSMIEGNALG